MVCTNPSHPFSYPPREQMYRDLLEAERRLERERAGYLGGIAYALRLLDYSPPGPDVARLVLAAMLDGHADRYVSMADREMRAYQERRRAARAAGEGTPDEQ